MLLPDVFHCGEDIGVVTGKEHLFTKTKQETGSRIRIAVSCFGEEVAPCFETARRFRFWEIVDGEAHRYRELEAEGQDALSRVRLLHSVKAQVLICNGISERVREILETEGCVVIDGVLGSATDALFGFLAGHISPRPATTTLPPFQMQPHTADLVDWTIELFRNLGWTVHRVEEDNLLPIDLTAEKPCPLCGKPVRIAVCCGAHAYRIEEEIQELKRITAASYHSRVYVHHALPGLRDTCRDFEIELLDPRDFANGNTERKQSGTLPPLKNKVTGHEKLNATEQTSAK
jgi:predicted Fe-Mo cluster-binding NifX family protein